MHAIEWITFKRDYALPTGAGTPILFVAGDVVRSLSLLG